MCKFIFCLRSRREMNEPRRYVHRRCSRRVGHEGKKEEESFWCCYGYLLKIGMTGKIFALISSKKMYYP
jgi:hypothetical protein